MADYRRTGKGLKDMSTVYRNDRVYDLDTDDPWVICEHCDKWRTHPASCIGCEFEAEANAFAEDV